MNQPKKAQDIDEDDWIFWIEELLPDHLCSDFQHLLVFTEADLQSSICTFLRRKVRDVNNPHWRVLNQPFQKKSKEDSHIYPDILITYKGERKIAMELKQSVNREARVPFKDIKKDVEKMGVYGSESGIRTYVLWTCCQTDRSKAEERENTLQELASNFEPSPNVMIIDLAENRAFAKVIHEMRSIMAEIQLFYGDED